VYSKDDEQNLILKGYVAFLDPPKETAAPALTLFNNTASRSRCSPATTSMVSRKICKEVGLPLEHVLTGAKVEGDERRRAGRGCGKHDVVCPSLARPQAAHH